MVTRGQKALIGVGVGGAILTSVFVVPKAFASSGGGGGSGGHPVASLASPNANQGGSDPVTVTGFKSGGEVVDITLDSALSPSIGNIIVNATGAGSGFVHVPVTTPIGTHTVIFTGKTSGFQATAPLTVNAEGNVSTFLSPKVYVPAYFRDQRYYDRIIASKRAHADTVDFYVAVNPNSGPYTTPATKSGVDAQIVGFVKQLQDAGIKVLGYVPTGWRSRPLTEVQAMIKFYADNYGTDGIMFDEMDNKAGGGSYYRQATAYAKGLGMIFTIGNPGVPAGMTAQEYIGSVDNIHIWEAPAQLPPTAVLQQLDAAAPAAQWGIIPYDIATLPADFISSLKNMVGMVYITNDGAPIPGSNPPQYTNPWDTLPPYFESMVDQIAAQAPPTGGGGGGGGTNVQIDLDLRAYDMDSPTTPVDGIPFTITGGPEGMRTMQTGSTLVTFRCTVGEIYTVTAGEGAGETFIQWGGGPTPAQRDRQFAPDANTQNPISFNAFYRKTTGPGQIAVAVAAEDEASGAPLNMFTRLLSSTGGQIATGFTPTNFIISIDTPYQIEVQNFDTHVFDTWSDGDKTMPRPISSQGGAGGNISLLARFKTTPA